MQAIGELWKLLWCCRSNFTFLFLSFSPPFLFPSPLQVLSLDKSVSLLPTLSILPACLFPASALFSGAGSLLAASYACLCWGPGMSLALECPRAWSLPSSPRCGFAGQGLPGCTGTLPRARQVGDASMGTGGVHWALMQLH